MTTTTFAVKPLRSPAGGGSSHPQDGNNEQVAIPTPDHEARVVTSGSSTFMAPEESPTQPVDASSANNAIVDQHDQ